MYFILLGLFDGESMEECVWGSSTSKHMIDDDEEEQKTSLWRAAENEERIRWKAKSKRLMG